MYPLTALNPGTADGSNKKIKTNLYKLISILRKKIVKE